MYTLQVIANFDSAHFLKGYQGKCKNIHGHRWKVEAVVTSERLETEGQTRGMIVDFRTLKNDLRSLAEQLDHTLIIEEGSLLPETLAALHKEAFSVTELPFRPTAENLAKYFYDALDALGYDVTGVKVYETPDNCAGYSRTK